MISPWSMQWGDVPPPASSVPASTETAQELIPIAASLIEAARNPYRRYQRALARYQNAQQRGASAARLRLLKANLDAAAEEIALRRESTGSTRDWRKLGKAGAFSGIALLSAGTILLLVLARKSSRS